MKLDNLNKWLTLAANIGVLAGIIFLAMELRQNSELMRAESRNEMTNQVVERLTQGIESGEFADVLNRGLEGQELTEIEGVQFRRSYIAFIWVWGNLNYQYRTGLYDEDEYQLQIEVIRKDMLLYPGMMKVWCDNKNSAPIELIADIELGYEEQFCS